MANLTITINDDLLRRARVRAAEQDTSVNAVLREELTRYAGEDPGVTAAVSFVEFAKVNGGSSEGRTWSRDELYADRLDRG